MADSTVTTDTNAQGDATPGGGNVSDGTTPVPAPTPVSSGNDNSASTPATTRSDDTRGAGYDLTKLIDNLDSLPERVANAVREASAPVTPVPTPAPATTLNADTANAGNAATGTGDTGSTAKPSRQERLRGFWFGA